MLNTVPCRHMLSIPPDNHLLVDRSFVFAFVFAFVFVFVSVFLFVFLQASAFSSPRSPFSVSTSRAASPLPFAGTQCWKILSFDLHYVFCLFQLPFVWNTMSEKSIKFWFKPIFLGHNFLAPSKEAFIWFALYLYFPYFSLGTKILLSQWWKWKYRTFWAQHYHMVKMIRSILFVIFLAVWYEQMSSEYQ